MRIQQLEDSSLGLTAKAIEELFAPYVESESGPADKMWRAEVARRARKVDKKFWRRTFLGRLPALGRTAPKIEEEYNEVWDRTALDSYKMPCGEKDRLPWEWRDKRYIAHRFGGARIRLAVLMQVIGQLAPASVLEVGAGNGINLLYLAGRFPETRFAGLELTAEGVRAGQDCQQEWREFPAELLPFSPQPLRDRQAFRNVDFHQGSAQELPFAEGSFDLVTTVLALEQMERIRKPALREIARVTRGHVLMIEPFRDVNRHGMRRRYIISRDYFSASIRDLPRYGLQPVWATADFPQKAQMQFCCVLARKI
jgi:ubiquinone/menaquinone biosynthesis C-methylase UbiE